MNGVCCMFCAYEKYESRDSYYDTHCDLFADMEYYEKCFYCFGCNGYNDACNVFYCDNENVFDLNVFKKGREKKIKIQTLKKKK